MKNLTLTVILTLILIASTAGTARADLCSGKIYTQDNYETNRNLCPTPTGRYYFKNTDVYEWDEDGNKIHVNVTTQADFDFGTRTSQPIYIARTQAPGVNIFGPMKYYRTGLGEYVNGTPIERTYMKITGCQEYFPESYSPVVVVFNHSDLKLSDVDGGVEIDMEGDGTVEKLGWPIDTANVGFLIRGTAVVDGRVLYGNLSTQAPPLEGKPNEPANGYRALRLQDTNGDGSFSPLDANWLGHNIWFDLNRNGKSDAGEVKTFAEAGLARLSLSYQPIGKKDKHGNMVRYFATAYLADGSRRNSFDFFSEMERVTEPIVTFP